MPPALLSNTAGVAVASSLLDAAVADDDLLLALSGGETGCPLVTNVGCTASGTGPTQVPLYVDVLDLAAQALRATNLHLPSSCCIAQHKEHSKGQQQHTIHLPLGPLPDGSLDPPSDGSSDAENTVSRCLCGHYGVPRVELLGYGPASNIVKLARECLATHVDPGVLLPSGEPHFIVASPALVAAHSLITGVDVGPPVVAGYTLNMHETNSLLSMRSAAFTIHTTLLNALLTSNSACQLRIYTRYNPFTLSIPAYQYITHLNAPASIPAYLNFQHLPLYAHRLLSLL